MPLIKSGDLAKQAKVNPETLRYYEREGLLPEPERTEAGYRLYADDDVKRVKFIKRAQELGFALKEIKELLALRVEGTQSASKVKRLTQQKIQSINDKILTLQSMKSVLERLAEACSGQAAGDECPILNCLDDCTQEKKGGK